MTTKAVTSSLVMSLDSGANMHRFKLKIWMMDVLRVVTMSRVLSQTRPYSLCRSERGLRLCSLHPRRNAGDAM